MFLGIKDKGVYLAVLILFLVYVWEGFPSSSLNLSGNGKLKNKVLPSPSSEVVVLFASVSWLGSS